MSNRGAMLAIYLLCLIAVVCFAMGILTAPKAHAHEQWADGSAIPAWVKASCCGPADAHHLKPEQVRDEGDYYVVDGFPEHIQKSFHGTPNSSILPSQDGDYWIFYKLGGEPDCAPEIPGPCTSVSEPQVYCFFVPLDI